MKEREEEEEEKRVQEERERRNFSRALEGEEEEPETKWFLLGEELLVAEEEVEVRHADGPMTALPVRLITHK